MGEEMTQHPNMHSHPLEAESERMQQMLGHLKILEQRLPELERELREAADVLSRAESVLSRLDTQDQPLTDTQRAAREHIVPLLAGYRSSVVRREATYRVVSTEFAALKADIEVVRSLWQKKLS